MKKRFTFLLPLLLPFAGTVAAHAQAGFVPSTDEQVYEYYLQSAAQLTTSGNNKGTYDSYITTGKTEENGAKYATSGERLRVKVVAVDGADTYRIVPLNVEGFDPQTAVLGVSENDDDGQAVKFFTSADEATYNQFTITASTAYEPIPSIKALSVRYSIAPTADGTVSTRGLNTYRGGINASDVKLYDTADQGSMWAFLPANEAAWNKFYETNQTALSTSPITAGTAQVGAQVYFLEELVVTDYAAFADAITVGLPPHVYLPEGYYRLKNGDNSSDFTTYGAYAFSDFLDAKERNEYRTRGNVPSEEVLAQNNYTWHITREGTSTTIGIVGGQGVGICNGTEYKQLTLGSSTTAPENDVYFTEGLHMSNQNYVGWHLIEEGKVLTQEQLLTNPLLLGSWTRADSPGSNWYFEPVDMTDKVAYTVSITGGGNADAHLTRTATSEIALNGGFFLLSATPQTADFTFTEIADYTGNLQVDEENKTLVLNYVHDNVAEALAAAVASAEEALSHVGVGYPAEGSATRTTLADAVATAKAEQTSASVNALTAAVTAYKSSTEDILMPEDGKAYVFINVNPVGGKRYFNYADEDEGLQTVALGETTSEELPMTAKFICRKLDDGRYTFANNAGKYLKWKGGASTNSGNGFDDSYNAQHALTFNKMTTTSTTTLASSNADFFGYVKFGGYRDAEKNSNFIIKHDGSFDHSGSLDDAFFNTNGSNTFSCAFEVIEVAYPNNVTLNSADGIEGVATIGTFSAPFPTVVPEGVTAYYVSSATAAEGASTQAIAEGEAVPANTGVLLTATEASVTSALMRPAAGETAATIAEGANWLGQSAGADKTIAADENAYILTAQNGVVAFYPCSQDGRTLRMNKSYLVLPAAASVQSVALSFGQGAATGIGTVAAATDGAAAPLYDLSGRRVTRPAKGGVYIREGKKIIVR